MSRDLVCTAVGAVALDDFRCILGPLVASNVVKWFKTAFFATTAVSADLTVCAGKVQS